MFYLVNSVLKSSLLSSPSVNHAFSTRLGGVSRAEHTRTMNLSFGLGDSDGEVLENVRLFCQTAGVSADGLCASPQFHTTKVRHVTPENALEGILKENPSPSDAFVTASRGVSVMIRMADCVPLLFLGEREDFSPVIGAAHAGWKGTAGKIAEEVVREMEKLGARRDSIKVAIGQCIHKCCFEVKEDFYEAVTALAGKSFAERYTERRDGRMYADLVAMNMGILTEAGVRAENIDVCRECTACSPDRFHSHRATGGKRGTMGAVIGIL